MTPYKGPVSRLYGSNLNAFTVTVYPSEANPRSFLAMKNSLTWDGQVKSCYYGGNNQGGNSDTSVPNGPVIEGTYLDYITDDLFAFQFKYNRFKGCNP